ncbi:MAG: hypothetical protein AB1813_22455 [Verrucomicrobiota bacterium]
MTGMSTWQNSVEKDLQVPDFLSGSTSGRRHVPKNFVRNADVDFLPFDFCARPVVVHRLSGPANPQVIQCYCDCCEPEEGNDQTVSASAQETCEALRSLRTILNEFERKGQQENISINTN